MKKKTSVKKNNNKSIKIANKDIPILYIGLAVLGVIVLVILIGFIYNRIEESNWKKELLKDYDEIEYSVPNEFEKLGDFHSYGYYSDDVTCRFSIVASDKYEEDTEKWFKSNIYSDLNSKVSSVEKKTINGKEVYYVQIKSHHSVEHHYGFISSNHYYDIEYKINDSLDGDRVNLDKFLCYSSLDKVISSIKTK